MKAEFKLHTNFKQKSKLLFILCMFAFLVTILLSSHQALLLLLISSKVIGYIGGRRRPANKKKDSKCGQQFRHHKTTSLCPKTRHRKQ
jgi:hypothetical protein